MESYGSAILLRLSFCSISMIFLSSFPYFYSFIPYKISVPLKYDPVLI